MSIRKTPVEYYYWNNADNLTWESSITWAEPVKRYAIDGSFQEKSAISETARKKMTEPFKSAVHLVEFRTNLVEKISSEAIDFAVTYWDYIAFLLRFVDSLHIDEEKHKSFKTAFKDGVGTGDGLIKEVSLLKNEVFPILDNYSRQADFLRWVLSDITVIGKMSDREIKQFSSSFGLKDRAFKGEAKSSKESISVEEFYTRTVNFIRKYDEWSTIAHGLAKKYGFTDEDVLLVMGSILHKAKAVISDICFSSEEIDVDSPPGYGPFKRFLPGDYNYEKAIFKTRIETSLTGKKALLDDFLLKVDLPDIQDMGTISIPAKATKVKFNKAFFRTPEVTITMRAGEGIVPVPAIQDVTREYFIVELQDSEGKLIEGTISWTALGC